MHLLLTRSAVLSWGGTVLLIPSAREIHLVGTQKGTFSAIAPPQLWNTLPHVTRPAYCSSLINSFFGNWQKWSCSGGPSCDLLWVFILLSWGVGGGIMIISAVILLNFSVIDSFLLCLYIFRFYSILLCFTLCKPSWGRQWLWEGGQSINQTKRFNNCPEVCLVEGRVKLGRWTKTYSTDLSMITPGGGGGAS